ncbi:MAG: SDR family NAD(P)-dependent oxidoreductase [Armatimonadota bacterium]
MSPVAVVTGVGKPTGLGFEVCRQLAQEGFKVILTARNSDAASELASTLAAEGLSVEGRQLDISSDESIRQFANSVQTVDVLINNAVGMAPWGETASNPDFAAVQSVLDTTLFGTWRLTVALLEKLKASPGGRIVNVSSGAGSFHDTIFGVFSGNPMGTSYPLSKAALNVLTAKLAQELRDSNLKINAVCPGFTATFPGGAEMGARPASESAKGVVWAATLPSDGPTGGFFRDRKPLDW